MSTGEYIRTYAYVSIYVYVYYIYLCSGKKNTVRFIFIYCTLLAPVGSNFGRRTQAGGYTIYTYVL